MIYSGLDDIGKVKSIAGKVVQEMSRHLTVALSQQINNRMNLNGTSNSDDEKVVASKDLSSFRFETSNDEDVFGENPFDDKSNTSSNLANFVEPIATTISSTSSRSSANSSTKSCSSHKAVAVPSLFEEDVEFVGVELEDTEKAMEQVLEEGIVGEAGPLKRNIVPKMPEKEESYDCGAGMKEFNDSNYWRVDQEVTVLE